MRQDVLTVPEKPYLFDGRYSACYVDVPFCIDQRHVYIIHEVLTSWPFKHALEIGGYMGASSTAFVEANKRDWDLRLTFCDVEPTDSLRQVIAGHRLVTKPSWELLDDPGEQFDFILVDGNHDSASVGMELQRLIPREPLCVMAHDTSASSAGFPLCEGARELKETFIDLPGYRCIEDAAYRPGELTHRGLFLATRDADLFAIARQAFEKWS